MSEWPSVGHGGAQKQNIGGVDWLEIRGRYEKMPPDCELEVGPPHAINCYEKIAPLIFRHNFLRAEVLKRQM